MLKIHYKTKFHFTHQISNEYDLVDQSCAQPHEHDSVLIVTVPITDKFLDFKTVKQETEKVLSKLEGKNITDEFGLGKTEQLVKYLAGAIGKELGINVNVYLQETHKYGMEYVSD